MASFVYLNGMFTTINHSILFLPVWDGANNLLMQYPPPYSNGDKILGRGDIRLYI